MTKAQELLDLMEGPIDPKKFKFFDDPKYKDKSFKLKVKAKDNHGSEFPIEVVKGVLKATKDAEAAPPMGWVIDDIIKMTSDKLWADMGQKWSIDNIQAIKKEILKNVK